MQPETSVDRWVIRSTRDRRMMIGYSASNPWTTHPADAREFPTDTAAEAFIESWVKPNGFAERHAVHVSRLE